MSWDFQHYPCLHWHHPLLHLVEYQSHLLAIHNLLKVDLRIRCVHAEKVIIKLLIIHLHVSIGEINKRPYSVRMFCVLCWWLSPFCKSFGSPLSFFGGLSCLFLLLMLCCLKIIFRSEQDYNCIDILTSCSMAKPLCQSVEVVRGPNWTSLMMLCRSCPYFDLCQIK